MSLDGVVDIVLYESPWGNLSTQTISILREFIALFLFSAQQKELLNRTQSKLSKELWMPENRPVLPEIKYFLLELLACVHVHEGIKVRRQLEVRENVLLFS